MLNYALNFPPMITHAKVIKTGYAHYLHIRNYLLNLYVKTSNLTYAHQLFDEIPERDVRSWTILISGYSRIGSHKLGLDLFTQMQKQGISPNQFTFSAILKCCAATNEQNTGQRILGSILRNGVCLDITLSNSVLDFYVKCESFVYARKFFDTMMGFKDIVSWNIMISGYLKNGDMEKAEELFSRLPVKNAATWNTFIDGYLQNGRQEFALQLLYKMAITGLAFTDVTFSIALVIASSLNHIKLGKQIHGRLLRLGIHDAVIKNSLIDMYCKCGQMNTAMFVFKSTNRFASLSSLVSGYIQNGRTEDVLNVLNVFNVTIREQGTVDVFTLASVLSACANGGFSELGRLIHTYILKTGHEDVFVTSSMIQMYAKCGMLQSAWSIFNQSKTRNVVLWTAIISSYASHGEGVDTIRLFELMRNQGVKPNEVTFVAVLTACSHAGLVTEGCKYFMLMKTVYAIEPEVEHYACVVDLLGRAGRLSEVKGFILENDISHLGVVLKAFLSSCYLHKNVEMARWVAEKLRKLEPSVAGSYVLMSKTFAGDSRWEEAAKLKDMMQERGIKKKPGQSWIQ